MKMIKALLAILLFCLPLAAQQCKFCGDSVQIVCNGEVIQTQKCYRQWMGAPTMCLQSYGYCSETETSWTVCNTYPSDEPIPEAPDNDCRYFGMLAPQVAKHDAQSFKIFHPTCRGTYEMSTVLLTSKAL